MKVTKEEIFKDICEVAKNYQKENPASQYLITEKYYISNSKYKKKYEKFGTFTELRKEAFKDVDIEGYEKDKKIFILEEENKELKEKNKSLLKKAIDEDSLLEIYKDNLLKSFQYPTDCKIYKSENNLCAVLNLCDFHLGEIVKPEEVNGTNEFNKKICIQRLDKIFETFKYRSEKYKIRNCCIFLNGDLISGGIHEELVRYSDLNEVESILYLQPYLIKKFTELSKIFNNIDVEVVVGNHSRILSGRPYYKGKTTMNYEYLLGMQLKMYFDVLRENKKNNKININVPKSAFTVKEINSTKFLATHGDILSGAGSGGFAGIPFYSICMSASKLFGILCQIGFTEDIHFDHIICGHLHTTTKIPLFNGGYCFVGGCVIGTNEYSLMKMKSVAKKEQLMLIIDDTGNIISEINIKF